MIELLVATGLMAILLTMIAQIFMRSTAAFRVARASVEIHENVRGAMDVMMRDFTGADLCAYQQQNGYFSLSQERTENGQPVLAITFTTLADQAGARPLVPGVGSQLALVRYVLEFDGRQATMPDGSLRPTYNLVKKIRFPQLAYPFTDMSEFEPLFISPPFPANINGQPQVPDENITSEILAQGVLGFNARFLYAPNPDPSLVAERNYGVYYLNVRDFGHATTALAGGSTANNLSLTDSTKNWTTNWRNSGLRLHSWLGGGARRLIDSTAGNVIDFTSNPIASPVPNDDGNTPYRPPAYRIEAAVERLTDNLTITTAGSTTVNVTADWRGTVVPGDFFLGPDNTPRMIVGVTQNTLTLATPSAVGATGVCRLFTCTERVTSPTWIELNPPADGMTAKIIESLSGSERVRMPSLVEVTLEMTDSKSTRFFTFTSRFHIPASEKTGT